MPVFDSHEHATNMLWHFMVRMGRLIAWGIIAIGHLTAVTALLALAWWTETTPAEAWGTAQQMLQTSTVKALVALGVSALTLAGLYVVLIRWAHTKIGSGWLVEYLMKGAPGS